MQRRIPALGAIFDARRVAVIGASSKRGNLAARIVRNMLEIDFAGEVIPVGRSDETLFERKVYKSVLDIPGEVDLAAIAVPAQLVPDMLEECGKKGIPFASITSGGFGEYVPERKALDERLTTIARQYGMRFFGPNCQGLRNFETGLSTRFGKQYKQTAAHCIAGLIVQSGTISSTFERFLRLEGIGLTLLSSIGNKLNVDESDLLPIYLAHAPTELVFMYLEGIRRGRAFFDACKEATKPVVLLKGNISPTAARIASSHSASVLNEQRVTEAAARQAGVTLIERLADSQLVAKAFRLAPLRGRNLVIFGGSGGMDVIGADWAHRTGFTLVALPEATVQSIESRMPGGYIKISNPVDIGDFFDMKSTLVMIDEVLALPQVDGMVICSFDPTEDTSFHNRPEHPFAVEIRLLMEKHDKPIALVYAAQREAIQKASAEADFPIFAGTDEAMIGLRALQAHWHRRLRPADPPPVHAFDAAAIEKILAATPARGRAALPYAGGFALLAAAGIPVAAPHIVTGEDDAVTAAARTNGPVVLKLLPQDGAHKTELGGLRLRLEGGEAVRRAYRELRALDARLPIAVQPMMAGVELMLGARRDEHFGPVVSVGLGGTLVELLDDVALRLAPFGPAEAREMLDETRAATLLRGVRGAAPSDAGAVLDALVRLAQLVADHPQIAELDVNPVIVLPEGRGLCAVDARVFVGG